MRRTLLSALAATALLTGLTAPPAAAAPPEGCVGFPSIPEAYVCITSFTPENAVPVVGTGPDQTVTIPEFCVFECVGPTPVTVPSVTVTPGSGLVATITYDGQTYPVAIPTVGGAGAIAAEAQRLVTETLASVLATAGDTAADAVATVQGIDTGAAAFVLSGQMVIDCFGCGAATGTLYGSAASVVDATAHQGTAYGTFYFEGPAATCPVTGAANGTLQLPGIGDTYFTWTMVGGIVMLTYSSAGGAGFGFGTFYVVGNPCGQSNVSAEITMTGVLA